MYCCFINTQTRHLDRFHCRVLSAFLSLRFKVLYIEMWKTEMLIVFILTVSNVILAKCDEPMSENLQPKRILLNDPDVLGKRLTNMKYTQQQGVITSLRNELANGKLIQDKLQLQYSQQEVEITSLRNGLADEKLKHEQSLISKCELVFIIMLFVYTYT